ncbi:prostaglandin-H2 D-isomerase [Monoraphidium neglectum]|uniref:Prostaglandin-H2 D-isomerase n=1 Tax=Monoraphidium neglectum TaxID=145388 RepID=A0A0D2JIB7_9CHLO|nr:prostaglandin-H2 D-isomerase [Monoraphidium neglectum]KIY99082.1 prostaglandin-H2 D-isomerase [Monoraphidium neglectum]|eukprot:XP_013898102.1 prostaglandin-H2 D-isomerase [Monoraphidium neglectum]
MPTYKLYYFPLPGRAEVARLCGALGGLDLEDVRFKGEEWPKLKAIAPFGQAPFLEVDGKFVAQSAAIDRYLAAEAGLVPKDAFQAALADQAYALCHDIMQTLFDTFKIKHNAGGGAAAARPGDAVASRAVSPAAGGASSGCAGSNRQIQQPGADCRRPTRSPLLCFPQDADEKIKAREAAAAGPLKDRLALADALVDKAGDGFVTGPEITHGDLNLFVTLSALISGWLDGVPKTLLNDFPALKAYRNRVASDPRVKAFYEREDNQDNIRQAFKPDA